MIRLDVIGTVLADAIVTDDGKGNTALNFRIVHVEKDGSKVWIDCVKWFKGETKIIVADLLKKDAVAYVNGYPRIHMHEGGIVAKPCFKLLVSYIQVIED